MDGAAGARARAVSIDAAVLDAACEGFHRTHPGRSAKRVLTWRQAVAIALVLGGLGFALQADAALTAHVAMSVAYVLFAVAIALRFAAASNLRPLVWRLADKNGAWPVYTILCPLYREANVLPDLLAALGRLDYPRAALDIKLLIEADDADTLAAALQAVDGPHIEIVTIPPAPPRTKPKALNVGLARAKGELLAVYDAEDRPHPQQLRAALAAFNEGGDALAAVQAPLAPDNGAASWLARQFAAEYAIQFREILPLLASLGLPLPLGGSSNHFRVEALRLVGGWDPYNVTEDMDLGYRLARARLRAAMIAPPTWEEAPVTFGAWLKQRTRWIKGHLQTWLVLMRNPLRAGREMGWGAFASMHITLGAGLAASLLHAPMALIVLAAFVSPADILGFPGFVLALSGYCVGAFAALTAVALSGETGHARAAFTMPFYWPLLSLAAVCAVGELILRPHHWAKTQHGVSARPAQVDGSSRLASSAAMAATSASV